MPWRTYAVLPALLAALIVPISATGSEMLPASTLSPLSIDPEKITVSGVSSGGYLAHQMHVALSETISGAGIIAAGPYYCAGEAYPWNLFRTLDVCMNFPDLMPFLGPPDAANSLAEARAQADAGRIDHVRNLRDDKVFLFSGTEDDWVPRSVVDAAANVYRALGPQDRIKFVTTIDAPHGMITDDSGNACDQFTEPYVNDCDYDLAGAMLSHFYGPLAPPAENVGEMTAFDQREFFDTDVLTGLADEGYIYVPKACADGALCRLHVALHGCLQDAETVGDAFYRGAGYNEWAETNNIVVLYPQARRVTTSLLSLSLPWPNPAGCWDWWGFTGPDYHLKSGHQISAIKAMIDRLAKPKGSEQCPC
ncbi:MAG: hypothetical protein H6905_09760 [Hyphomicrobiales bacterium]|nr:hypothetical protein [Hyphomicrobiales bacterium]